MYGYDDAEMSVMCIKVWLEGKASQEAADSCFSLSCPVLCGWLAQW